MGTLWIKEVYPFGRRFLVMRSYGRDHHRTVYDLPTRESAVANLISFAKATGDRIHSAKVIPLHGLEVAA